MESFIEKVRMAGKKTWHVKKSPASPVGINKNDLEELQDICEKEKIYPRYVIEGILEMFFDQYRKYKDGTKQNSDEQLSRNN